MDALVRFLFLLRPIYQFFKILIHVLRQERREWRKNANHGKNYGEQSVQSRSAIVTASIFTLYPFSISAYVPICQVVDLEQQQHLYLGILKKW